MMSNSLIFPEVIRTKIEDGYKERKKKLSPSQIRILSPFLDPKPEIDGDKEVLQNFLDFLQNDTYEQEFVNLIENFEDLEAYHRFLASVLIYMRTENFNDPSDKFLYLCISIEAAMQFKSNRGKEKNRLFKAFFKENLAEDTKLRMISHFKSKNVINTVKSQDFLLYKAGKTSLRKTKGKSIVPSCYKLKQCFLDTGKCYPQHGCYLKSNPDKINDQLNFVLDYLYQKRSNFVHDGRIFAHPVNGSIGDVCCYSAQKKLVGISYSLNLYDLFEIYEEALLNHFKTINGL
mgnify:CR=1 FL=1